MEWVDTFQKKIESRPASSRDRIPVFCEIRSGIRWGLEATLPSKFASIKSKPTQILNEILFGHVSIGLQTPAFQEV